MTSSAIYTDGENELKELSEEDIEELRKIAKEELYSQVSDLDFKPFEHTL